MSMEILTLVVSVITFLGGYGLNYFFERRKEYKIENAKILREAYLEFVQLIFDILIEKNSTKDVVELDKRVRAMMKSFYPKAVLHSSPELIVEFSNYMHSQYKNKTKTNQEIFDEISKIILKMRREIGLSNRKLGKNGEKVFRALVTDFDTIYPPHKKFQRTKK